MGEIGLSELKSHCFYTNLLVLTTKTVNLCPHLYFVDKKGKTTLTISYQIKDERFDTMGQTVTWRSS